MSGQMPHVDSAVLSATMGSREVVEGRGRAAGRMRWVSEDGVDGREGKQEEAPTLLLLAEGRRASATGLSLPLLPALLSSIRAQALSAAVRGCVRGPIY